MEVIDPNEELTGEALRVVVEHCTEYGRMILSVQLVSAWRSVRSRVDRSSQRSTDRFAPISASPENGDTSDEKMTSRFALRSTSTMRELAHHRHFNEEGLNHEVHRMRKRNE
jgi:hypothetical protein